MTKPIANKIYQRKSVSAVEIYQKKTYSDKTYRQTNRIDKHQVLAEKGNGIEEVSGYIMSQSDLAQTKGIISMSHKLYCDKRWQKTDFLANGTNQKENVLLNLRFPAC